MLVYLYFSYGYYSYHRCRGVGANCLTKRWDLYRLLSLRSSQTPDKFSYKNKEQYQFIFPLRRITPLVLASGACPGRFCAAKEIKLIQPWLVLDFDVKMADGITKRYCTQKCTLAHRLQTLTISLAVGLRSW